MESNLTSNSQPTTIVEPVSKQSSFLVILLSSLLIISCLIAGFFAWKTQQLVKELRVVGNDPKPTPVATQIPDQTLLWREYINTKNGFAFKIPDMFKFPETIVADDSNYFSTSEGIDSPLALSTGDVLLESTVYTNINSTTLKKTDLIETAKINEILDQPFQPIGKLKKMSVFGNNGSILAEVSDNDSEPKYYIAVIRKDEKVYSIKMFASNQNFEDLSDTFNKMVSTFRFINPEAISSPLPVACTMEAKICPDGTAVGRSGPNCEFPSCPKPQQ